MQNTSLGGLGLSILVTSRGQTVFVPLADFGLVDDAQGSARVGSGNQGLGLGFGG